MYVGRTPDETTGIRALKSPLHLIPLVYVSPPFNVCDSISTLSPIFCTSIPQQVKVPPGKHQIHPSHLQFQIPSPAWLPETTSVTNTATRGNILHAHVHRHYHHYYHHCSLQHIPKLSKLKSRLPTHQSKSPPREALSLPPGLYPIPRTRGLPISTKLHFLLYALQQLGGEGLFKEISVIGWLTCGVDKLMQRSYRCKFWQSLIYVSVYGLMLWSGCDRRELVVLDFLGRHFSMVCSGEYEVSLCGQSQTLEHSFLALDESTVHSFQLSLKIYFLRRIGFTCNNLKLYQTITVILLVGSEITLPKWIVAIVSRRGECWQGRAIWMLNNGYPFYFFRAIYMLDMDNSGTYSHSPSLLCFSESKNNKHVLNRFVGLRSSFAYSPL